MFRRLGRVAAVFGLLLVGVVPALSAAGQATPVATGLGPWNGDVCYEIFVRSFSDSDGDGNGDLNGLTEKLDYLNDGDPTGGDDLGVTCVWLMPVMESTSYHGYDVEDYYAIEQDYGTLADFDVFTAAAHERGIRVLLDLVLNHTSVEHPWFKEAAADPESAYRDWYIFREDDPGYLGPWGAEAWHPAPSGDGTYYGVFWSGMPDLNYQNPAVTAEAEAISSFWLEHGADGFRFDAIKHLIEDGKTQENTPATHDWLRAYRAWLEATWPEAVVVGEIFNASASLLEPYYPDQLHAYFQFDLASQMLGAAQSGMGDGIAYILEEALGKQPSAPWGLFLTNHDQNRTMSQLVGDAEAARFAGALLMLLPGVPFVYYGEEIGLTGTKPDERIRTPMPWDDSADGGFTTGRPWIPLTTEPEELNVADQQDDPASIWTTYADMIALRTANPALSRGETTVGEARPRNLLVMLREADGQRLLIVVNCGKEAVGTEQVKVEVEGLDAGEVRATDLLTGLELPLLVSEDGTVSGLPELAPRTALVLAIGE